MSIKLNCEIVRDLLPSYADGQTSDITNAAVEEHLAGCPDCAEILKRMKEPENPVIPQTEEIDYLKKVKRSKRRTAWIAALAVLAVCLVTVGIRVFVFGSAADLNAQAATVQVEDNVIHVDGSLTDSGDGVARIAFAEEGGVVDIQLYTAPSTPFNSSSFSKTYTADCDRIKAVTSGGLVIWENGQPVSYEAARLYAAKNPYVGDMPANQNIANIIGIRGRYGAYTNELQASEEPYGWTIILERPVDPAQEEKYRKKMASDTCLMIASIDNLGSVTWKYDNGSGQQEYTITRKDASEIAGEDIKSFAVSASGIQRLIEEVR